MPPAIPETLLPQAVRTQPLLYPPDPQPVWRPLEGAAPACTPCPASPFLHADLRVRPDLAVTVSACRAWSCNPHMCSLKTRARFLHLWVSGPAPHPAHTLLFPPTSSGTSAPSAEHSPPPCSHTLQLSG